MITGYTTAIYIFIHVSSSNVNLVSVFLQQLHPFLMLFGLIIIGGEGNWTTF
jgi:hypothetical protein